jgi:3-oxoadipate enol-lactonase
VPFIPVDNTRIYYRLEGNEDKPVLVLSHSLGADHGMWNPQVPQLLDYFRLLRYDTRGHGASDASPGDYTIERLARDVLALTDGLGIAQFAFSGLSLGGMTGQWIAAQAPGRITKLVLANTSAKFPDSSVMETRRQTVLTGGMKPIEDSVMQRFFMKSSLEGGDPYVASARTTLLATNPVGYAGCCAAVRDLDNRELLYRIECPTLIIAGDHDVSTPFAGHGELLAARISNSRVVHLPAAHLSNIEQPRSFSSVLLDFLIEKRTATVSPN